MPLPNHLEGSLLVPARLPQDSVAHLREALASPSELTSVCSRRRKGDGSDSCVDQPKGGVGKSTSATNVAFGICGVLRRMGVSNNRVLLIDTDSQGHATLVTTGRNDFGADDSLYSVLMADRQQAPHILANCIVQSAWDTDLHVLPASALLEGAAPVRCADHR
ncbi:MAG: AAA family ATPase [Anaerolineae bacterium]|nr:AAA family ATPase [Anaerolineae bacterium]